MEPKRLLSIGWLTLVFGLWLEGATPPVESRRITIAPRTEMAFRWIPPGQFSMGSAPEERGRDADEGPRASVTLTRGFYLGVYEVTQGQWKAVMGENPATFQQGEGHDARPVETVSWNDCVAFMKRLNGYGIGRFRLPTEAEWEYACRSGTESSFYWGEITEDWEAYRHAWTNSRSFATTHPVGTKPPNGWGLYDMSGNVWEWCSDWYGPYPSNDRLDPVGPERGGAKVFRGGSYYDFPLSLRSANRHRHRPDEAYTAIGLRLVWEPRAPASEATVSAPLPGGVLMRLARIPAGVFTMGSPSSEQGRQNDEGPVFSVTMDAPFYMGRTEVTQAQWQAVMGDNPSTFQRYPDSPNHPVERVSWEDIQRFLSELNRPENRVLNGRFSLPTEAEWEYACRAGSSERFPWGEDEEYRQLLDHAWFNSRAAGRSHPVGSKQPNAWGLFDMHGNVWEWCADSFAPYDLAPDAPIPGDSRKVIRGGSWFNEPQALRSANRHRHDIDSRQTNLGFRVVWRPDVE